MSITFFAANPGTAVEPMWSIRTAAGPSTSRRRFAIALNAAGQCREYGTTSGRLTCRKGRERPRRRDRSRSLERDDLDQAAFARRRMRQDPVQNRLPVDPVHEVVAATVRVHAERVDRHDRVRRAVQQGAAGVAAAGAAATVAGARRSLDVETVREIAAEVVQLLRRGQPLAKREQLDRVLEREPVSADREGDV